MKSRSKPKQTIEVDQIVASGNPGSIMAIEGNRVVFAPMDAANFNSGAATDGQVLTADGAGGAGWQAGGSLWLALPGEQTNGADWQTESQTAAFIAATGRSPRHGDIIHWRSEFWEGYAVYMALISSWSTAVTLGEI